MKVDIYDTALTLEERLLGAVPRNRDVYATYVAAKAPKGTDTDMEQDELDKVEEQGWTGFHQDETGIYLLDYAIKGFLKEAGNILKEAVGVRALRSKIDNVVFVRPRKVYLRRDGRILKAPDGVLERSLRAMTPQGPRVSLARSDYVEPGTRLQFALEVLAVPRTPIDESLLRTLFDYGAYKGIGQFRNGSYGRFSYKLERRSPTTAATEG